MKGSLDDLDRFVEADVRFHLQIASSADNVVLRDLLQSVRSLLRLWVERGLRDRDQGAVALREHIGIYEAIAARDTDAAEAAMRVHMTTAGDRVASLDL
jgi:GntR family transcriptional repressor for pyruvate dehydrogenase complex